jgi:glucokinase
MTLAAEPPVGGQPIRVVRARSGSRAVAIGAGSRVRTELGEVTGV